MEKLCTSATSTNNNFETTLECEISNPEKFVSRYSVLPKQPASIVDSSRSPSSDDTKLRERDLDHVPPSHSLVDQTRKCPSQQQISPSQGALHQNISAKCTIDTVTNTSTNCKIAKVDDKQLDLDKILHEPYIDDEIARQFNEKIEYLVSKKQLGRKHPKVILIEEVIEFTYPAIEIFVEELFSAPSACVEIKIYLGDFDLGHKQKCKGIYAVIEVPIIKTNGVTYTETISFCIKTSRILESLRGTEFNATDVLQFIKRELGILKLERYLRYIPGVCNKYTNTHISAINYEESKIILITNNFKKELALNSFFYLTKEGYIFEIIKFINYIGASTFMDLFCNDVDGSELENYDNVEQVWVNTNEDGSLSMTYKSLHTPINYPHNPSNRTYQVEFEKCTYIKPDEEMQDLLRDKKEIFSQYIIHQLGQKNLPPAVVSVLERAKYLNL